MYTLYRLNNKAKSSIKGFWLDKGKLYKDNISLDRIKGKIGLDKGIKRLFSSGEKVVFYSQGKKGYCKGTTGKLTVYNNRLRLHRQKLSCKEFKKLVYLFGGVTVYKLYDRYIIEVYHN